MADGSVSKSLTGPTSVAARMATGGFCFLFASATFAKASLNLPAGNFGAPGGSGICHGPLDGKYGCCHSPEGSTKFTAEFPTYRVRRRRQRHTTFHENLSRLPER